MNNKGTQRKGSFKGKILRHSLLTITLMLLMVFTVYYYFFHIQLKAQFGSRLVSLAKTTALMIDVKEHEKIKSRADENSKEYMDIKQTLQKVKKANPEINNIYTMRKTSQKDFWMFVVDAADLSHVGDLYDVSELDEMKRAFEVPLADNSFKTDQWGKFLSGYAPIKNSAGQAVAVVGIDIEAKTLIAQETKIIIGALVVLFLSLCLISMVNVKGINIFIKQFDKILYGIEQFSHGNAEYRIAMKTNDEFETIAVALNNAAGIISDYRRMAEKELAIAKEQREKIFKVYRDVIYSVTQGKFNLLGYKDSLTIEQEGLLITEVKLETPKDVNKAREAAEAYLKKKRFCSKDVAHILLCLSEAATNVIKHAQTGLLRIKDLDKGVRLLLVDNGPGMDFDKLPNMIFLEGFSTKISMGYGFSIIYKFADKIYMSTSKHGTFLGIDYFEHENVSENNMVDKAI